MLAGLSAAACLARAVDLATYAAAGALCNRLLDRVITSCAMALFPGLSADAGLAGEAAGLLAAVRPLLTRGCSLLAADAALVAPADLVAAAAGLVTAGAACFLAARPGLVGSDVLPCCPAWLVRFLFLLAHRLAAAAA